MIPKIRSKDALLTVVSEGIRISVNGNSWDILKTRDQKLILAYLLIKSAVEGICDLKTETKTK